MSRERAQRRAVRLAAQAKERGRRERARGRRDARRALVRRLTPRLPDRRTGRIFARRSRAQRITIAALVAVVVVGIWWYFDDLGARIALTALVAVALPAFIVISLDRRT